jgi:hypothetical protein
MISLAAFKDGDGTYITFAWPGGYPCYYLDNENNVLCPDCANKEDMSTEVVAGDVYYEGPPLICDDCGTEIESAYGDPGEEESEVST